MVLPASYAVTVVQPFTTVVSPTSLSIPGGTTQTLAASVTYASDYTGSVIGIVSEWLTNGDPNQGFAIIAFANSSTYAYSRESFSPPILDVTYKERCYENTCQ